MRFGHLYVRQIYLIIYINMVVDLLNSEARLDRKLLVSHFVYFHMTVILDEDVLLRALPFPTGMMGMNTFKFQV